MSESDSVALLDEIKGMMPALSKMWRSAGINVDQAVLGRKCTTAKLRIQHAEHTTMILCQIMKVEVMIKATTSDLRSMFNDAVWAIGKDINDFSGNCGTNGCRSALGFTHIGKDGTCASDSDCACSAMIRHWLHCATMFAMTWDV